MLLFRKFVNVGTATFSSRILGLVREIMMAAVLATGPVADVFYTCFRFPNLFRALFAEGAFNIAFVPLYAKELEKSKKDAKQFSAQVFAVLASWLIAFTAIAVLLMPVIVAYVLAPGFADTPDKLNLSITMTKIMFPYMMFMSLAAMFAGILNCLQRYFHCSHYSDSAQCCFDRCVGYRKLCRNRRSTIWDLVERWSVYRRSVADGGAVHRREKN